MQDFLASQVEHKELGGILQPLSILEWKWDKISIDCKPQGNTMTQIG